jgi:integrase
VLATLSKLLRVAKRLGVIRAVSVEFFELLKVPPPAVAFYTFEEYLALVAAAEQLDPRTLAAVLLGGDAGLRAGEVIGLELTDVSRANRLITVERQVWRGVVDSPKGGKGRSVPMTEKLSAALARVRHLRGARLLLQDDGSELTPKVLRGWMKSAQRLAGLKATGNFHILRHTFWSHLAMEGAPARVIRSWPATPSCRRRCGTCTCRPATRSRPSGYSTAGRWASRRPKSVEAAWRRKCSEKETPGVTGG